MSTIGAFLYRSHNSCTCRNLAGESIPEAMPFIRSLSIDTDRSHPFPYNIPAVQAARNIALDTPVTIFVGDNGSGKSTILETIAHQLSLPLIGGHTQGHHSFEAARILKPFLHLEWRRQTSKGFFFRAEDFSDFINAIDKQRDTLRNDLHSLEGEVGARIIQELSDGMNYQLHKTREQYGDDMQAYSHGEAYLKILQTRINGKGIYLLDEPEAALSPLKQLSLLSFIMEMVKTGHAQFIIATHSPIVMGLPGATLYQILATSMENVAYRETEHYSITKNFLENPDYYLRYL